MYILHRRQFPADNCKTWNYELNVSEKRKVVVRETRLNELCMPLQNELVFDSRQLWHKDSMWREKRVVKVPGQLKVKMLQKKVEQKKKKSVLCILFYFFKRKAIGTLLSQN